MDYFAVSEFVVLVLALLGVSLVFRLDNSLPLVIGLLLTAATATVAVLRYSVFKGGLAEMHGLYSQSFGFCWHDADSCIFFKL